jgi:hypothetical protein
MEVLKPAEPVVQQVTQRTDVPKELVDAAGVARTMGRLTEIVQGVGGTSATRCVFNYKEIR